LAVDGIIGHSGFVGGHLTRQHCFSGLFNSRNIDESAGAEFDTLVCAAAPGSMFEANKFPERDQAQIETLCQKLSAIKARRLILISSIAVLANFAGKDVETTEAFQTELAYGRHRRMLEAFCEDHFKDTLILRLPALFGTGLKKNFLFDLINPVPSMLNAAKMDQALGVVASRDMDILKKVYSLNPQNGMFELDRAVLGSTGALARIATVFDEHALTAVQFTNPQTTFQFYGVDRLWQDIKTASAQRIRVMHLATEPVAASRIHRAVTGRAMPETGARLHHEDMHTLHAKKWGQYGTYLEDVDQVVSRVTSFSKNQSKLK
jgi:hypothetical protein